MAGCLLCDKALTHATPEHILLDCLGGRLKTRRLICAACNKRLGGSIDAALARSVEPFRAAHGLVSGSRKRVPGGVPDPRLPNLDTPDCRRSMAKMLTLLWAEVFGGEGLDAAKGYLLDGQGDICLGRVPPLETLPGFGPLSHRLEVAEGIGDISLFGGDCWRFRLTETRRPGRVWLACDPSQPSEWLAGRGI